MHISETKFPTMHNGVLKIKVTMWWVSGRNQAMTLRYQRTMLIYQGVFASACCQLASIEIVNFIFSYLIAEFARDIHRSCPNNMLNDKWFLHFCFLQKDTILILSCISLALLLLFSINYIVVFLSLDIFPALCIANSSFSLIISKALKI